MSKAGDGMVVVALPLEALRLRGDLHPAFAVSLISAAPFILPVALSLVFGLGRRRFKPRRLMTLDCVLRFILFCAIAIAAMTHQISIWEMAAALFVGSGLRLLAASSRRLVATGMVDDGSRFAVNGLLGISDSLSLYVVGPVLGGILSTQVGPGFVLLLDGFTFLILLAVVAFVVPREAAPSEERKPSLESGWKILRRFPVSAWLFLVVFCFNLFYMPVEIALPLLVRGPFASTGGALGVMWTSFGVGALVGALGANRLRRLNHTSLLVSIIGGWAACTAVLAIAPNIVIAAVAFGVGGVIYAPFTPVAYSLVQEILNLDQQQPVLTLWAAGTAVAAPIGLLLGGLLVQTAGIRPGLLVSALLTVALVPVAVRIIVSKRDR